jgi:hypothetical protein
MSIELLDSKDRPHPLVYTWDPLKFRIHYFARRRVKAGSLELRISDRYGTTLILLSTQPDSTVPVEIRTGYHFADCELEQLPLSAGVYIVGAGLAIPNKEWLYREDALGVLTVQARDVYQSGLAPQSARSLLAVPHRWRV